MLQLPNVTITEASRVYGYDVEKIAFDLGVNPVNVVASALGGYAGVSTHKKIQDKQMQRVEQNLEDDKKRRAIENSYYDNTQNILKDLKIVFTPINVVYSVKGQVFEIIKTDEMSPSMRKAFIAKDGLYFKQLLLNKINMELQLAEQIFTRNLILQQLPSSEKEAKHVSLGWLEKVSTEDVMQKLNELEKKASDFSIPLNFDNLRPFDSVGDWKLVEKVANYFSHSPIDSLSSYDLSSQIKVGFLPDRVIYTYHGQLFEQLPLLHMNEEGFAAYKRRDKAFFKEFFLDQVARIQKATREEYNNDIASELGKVAAEEIQEETPDDGEWLEALTSVLKDIPSDGKEIDEVRLEEEEAPEELLEEEETEKTAATLEEVRSEWNEIFVLEKQEIDFWRETDIHPLAYDYLLEQQYGDVWHETDLSITLRQIIDDFQLEEMQTIVSDKIAFLQMVQNLNHSVYQNAFSFEKFVRAMNSKTINFSEYEAGLEFEELIFAFHLVSSLSNDEHVFYEFGEDVPNYVAKCLKADGIRFVSDQLYDETNEGENEFFEDVNGFLMRIWQEEDSLSLLGEEAEAARRKTVRIRDVVETCIRDYAELLEPTSPYLSAERLLRDKSLLFQLSEEEFIAIRDLVARHVIATVFLEMKKHELIQTIELLQKEGVKDDE